MNIPTIHSVPLFSLKGSTTGLSKAESTSNASHGTGCLFAPGASVRHQHPQGNAAALRGLRPLPLQRNGGVLYFRAHHPLLKQEKASVIREMQRLLLFLGSKRTGNRGLTELQYFCTYYTYHCVENFMDFWSYCTFESVHTEGVFSRVPDFSNFFFLFFINNIYYIYVNVYL